MPPAWPCIDERASFYLAGYAADRRFAPLLATPANTADDFREALALVDASRLERLLIETDRLVAEHWRAVEAVAAALLEREALSAMELHAVIIRSR